MWLHIKINFNTKFFSAESLCPNLPDGKPLENAENWAACEKELQEHQVSQEETKVD